MRGTPTIKDYQYIENQTGLKSGVTLDNIKKNLQNQVNIAEENTTNIGDMTEDLYNKIYSFTFPNNTKIDGLRSLQAWNRLMQRMPFNKVQYNPATYTEDIWARQHGYK